MTKQSNSVTNLLWLENLCMFLLCVGVFDQLGGNFVVFAATILIFDISAFGYLFSKRLGAITYNLGHTISVPALFALLAVLGHVGWLLLISIIWLSHIYLDRSLGYGLKLEDFHHTHLGPISKAKKNNSYRK